jgi:hypothetical protein
VSATLRAVEAPIDLRPAKTPTLRLIEAQKCDTPEGTKERVYPIEQSTLHASVVVLHKANKDPKIVKQNKLNIWCALTSERLQREVAPAKEEECRESDAVPCRGEPHMKELGFACLTAD